MDVASLNPIPLFASLSEDARRQLAFWVTELSVSAGEHLVDESDFAYALFVIEAGAAEVLHDGKHMAMVGPGDFFGELGVLRQVREGATVIAMSPMRLLALSSWDVKSLARSAPEVLDQLMDAIAKRSRAQS